MADEVYQENIYTERKFYSFKKILRDLQKENPGKFDLVQLVSFHSTSKGLLGECGQRGGYMELVGFDEPTIAQFNKVAASCLSSNTLGQIFVGLMCTPPPENGPSYPLFKQERQNIYDGLKRRAEAISQEFNKIEGMSCQRVQGAMYAFVNIELPKKATEAAKVRGFASADVMYCLDLVEQTGIVCVPGNGFKEVEGTNHFRITILPPDDMMKEMIGKLADFHKNFLAKYH
ncbi:Alanine aminotransferase, putative [Perkinsus marinus ATCC 50983]|uniref:Alanine aminotransferase, putative n=1 Tax=Perkinsus marinus (strain ATCC 50983 / TXsc) TaxID=423536 RepID=C5KXC2_PERM5|nr:Alanine aminotransferase, putative [Perkinsus marinus ATCC 50983]EER10871.1 Alanine aminotransferase, putative [Perkinsus marinus ATCC 50983]|eukprot:XP_002779076.1 Alanine aminotransferase, putative [Perkinsus marinus ATCC 50983]